MARLPSLLAAALVSLWMSPPIAQGAEPISPDAPIVCDMCAEWNTPQKPFRIYGNTYYVGTAGLSAVLVSSSAGLVLLDGALSQSVPLIEANIRALGFRVEDVRWVLNSHAHYDHAGGIAALARNSKARVAASVEGARALRAGDVAKEDPQAGFGAVMRFAPVPQAEGLKSGEQITVGDLNITALSTPGHTPGGTSWTWKSCEGEKCVQVVYADSLNPVSAPGFRFSASTAAPTASPSAVDQLRKSIQLVSSLPCDVIIAVHPSFTQTFEKLEKQEKAAGSGAKSSAFIDPSGCREYAADAARRLETRLAEEAKAGGPAKEHTH